MRQKKKMDIDTKQYCCVPGTYQRARTIRMTHTYHRKNHNERQDKTPPVWPPARNLRADQTTLLSHLIAVADGGGTPNTGSLTPLKSSNQ